ncbi:MAG: pyruvate, phosphate dikinase [Candidatus Anammoximicrobium sp.]|nr:pyruvate, phosphate dikinase [Candidatus Anammoximicrobium sp.]
MGDPQLSTGMASLDRVFRGLLRGDNLVWQVDAIRDFVPFVGPYCRAASQSGRRLVYFRFADHPPLATEREGATVCELTGSVGFEKFITQIRRTIREAGRGAFFLFDCLSALAEQWRSDRMLGNFFMLTCPYVYDLESLAYFPILRSVHSLEATSPIGRTTQISIDVYRHQDALYIQPSKVEHRYSPTMYMLHAWKGDRFVPVTDSSTTAEVRTSMPWSGLDSVRFRLGTWNRTFLKAEQAWDALQRGERPAEDPAALFRTLALMVFTRDERWLGMAEKYLTLGDLLGIWKRMIGTGLIGGKSAGMLLARAILRRTHPHWHDLLEAHDSFFIGSDVFYSFLVENGCWWLRLKQHDRHAFLDDIEEARRRIITGTFPENVIKDFAEMLDYFGQSPVIVRSSSLLEDNYGNAFAGKYESVFCANQGSHQKRLEDFVAAVKTIYASTMNEKALRYRARRGLLDRDEQMPLLVQRVSGGLHGNLFFPHIAGVALSVNPYVWNKFIDPSAGVVRLVFGLGTRAVDRADDDYTRVVALNEPERRPETDLDEVRQYSQHRVDVIDLDANQLVSADFSEIVQRGPDLPVEVFASQDREMVQRTAEYGLPSSSAWVLTFDHLLTRTSFVRDLREMLSSLQAAYNHPVDLEFTANFFTPDQYRVNLVQCRPLQVVAGSAAAKVPAMVAGQDVVLEACGAVIGQSRVTTVDRVVYVIPSVYGQMPIQDRYSVARLIGRLLHPEMRPAEDLPAPQIMLIGPGRWGTTTPTLGVPVSFAEIDTVSVLCEIVAMREDLIPDVSLGTHFFNDLVECDMLYLALFPGRKGNRWNRDFLESAPNRLSGLIADASRWEHVIRVIDFPNLETPGESLKLAANSLEQKVVCYREKNAAESRNFAVDAR